MLSVCSSGQCMSQTVLETTAQDVCINQKSLHEQLPQDGDWTTVEYKCKPKNSFEA